MKDFRNLLVAVDLASGDELASEALVPPSEAAVAQAIWLAGNTGARLTFFYALNVSERAQQLIAEDDDASWNVLSHAKHVLAQLVQRAKNAGAFADYLAVFGKSWYEIVRQVEQNGFDLVIAGSRHQSRARAALLGSTGMKLLRKCTCPVWITQPSTHRTLSSVVAATDFSPACDLAVDLAASLVELDAGVLHVVHALARDDEDAMRKGGVSEPNIAGYRQEVELAAQREMERVLGRSSLQALGEKVQVHITAGDPQHVILQHVETHAADLLAMGTLARSGLSGMLMGNTAERILPNIECSLLAVKPTEFSCPIKFGAA